MYALIYQSEKREKEVSMAWLLSDVIARLSQTNLYQHADFVSSSRLQVRLRCLIEAIFGVKKYFTEFIYFITISVKGTG